MPLCLTQSLLHNINLPYLRLKAKTNRIKIKLIWFIISLVFPSNCYVPYQECIMLFIDGETLRLCGLSLWGLSFLYTHTPKWPSCQRRVHASVCAYVCVCLKGGENQVSMNPGRISIPFVWPINNSERCSIGKWQTGFSCLSWSGLEAHGWMNKERQSSCVFTLPRCHSLGIRKCLFAITTGGLYPGCLPFAEFSPVLISSGQAVCCLCSVWCQGSGW